MSSPLKEQVADILEMLVESFDIESEEDEFLESELRVKALKEALEELPAEAVAQEVLAQCSVLEFEDRMAIYLEFAAAGLPGLENEIRQYLDSDDADNVFDAVFALAYLGIDEGLDGIDAMIKGTYPFKGKPLVSEKNEISIEDIGDSLRFLNHERKAEFWALLFGE